MIENDLNTTLLVVKRLKQFDIKFIAIGGFAKYLYRDKKKFRDVDFFIPPCQNKSDNVVQFLKSFLPNHPMNSYGFNQIIRLKIDSLQFDFLPKLDGLDAPTVLSNVTVKKIGEESISVLSPSDLKTNITTIEKFIKP